jgi:hypothetical protein
MFTTLTIFAAWFAFGHSVADIILTNTQNNAKRKYNGRKKQTPVRVTTSKGDQ